MNDNELLLKYRQYKRKRNIIILVSFLLILLLLFIGYKFVLNYDFSNEVIPTEKIEDKKPILKLNTNEIEIYINDEIDYKKYIKLAYDNEDGELTEDVKYSIIDTSKIGKYEVIYYVFDSFNNMTQEILNVSIIDKQEEIKENQPVENETPKENITPSKKEEPKKENQETSKKEDNPQSTTQTVKYFLFKDGYTMNNVVEVCAKELQKSNRAGRCLPITDDAGIYLGMKLELN